MGVRIAEDTRQQKAKHGHIEHWMCAHGVEFMPRARALEFGDYIAEDEEGRPFGNISVDTKKDVNEVAANVGRDHARFVRECDKARAAGYRLVILVEEHPEYNDREKLTTWVSGTCRRCRRCNPKHSTGCRRYRFKPMQGATLAKIVARLEERHGVRFEFCAKRDTAKIICERLGVAYE